MAQSRRVNAERHKKPRQPLDETALERTALFYVERYATTRARLRSYLARKIRERGWAGSGDPDVEALVARISTLGYVDDAAFAVARAASLQRRGFGDRRIRQALQAAGIEEDDASEARDGVREGALESALRFAQRRRIGPFASGEPDRAAREKAFAAMMRAGHPMDIVRAVLDAGPGEIHQYDIS